MPKKLLCFLIIVFLLPKASFGGAIFGISGSAGLYSLQSSDPATGGTLTISTPQFGYSGEVSWIQYWENNWEFDFHAGQRFLQFASPTNVSVENLSQRQTYYNLGIGRELSSRLKVLVEGAFSNYPILVPIDSISNTLYTVGWFSAGISTSFIVIQTNSSTDKALIKVSGFGHLFFPDDANFPIGFSNIDFGIATSLSYDRKRWTAELGAFYANHLMASTSIQQSIASIGITLGFSIKVGSAAKLQGSSSSGLNGSGESGSGTLSPGARLGF